ncbi:MAG TPA: class A beta-lactamase-related serine hydrolase [Deltaproteobacteria bacterium]|nr:class A beta-lactamase-related serine hydrolase [Deltaproteobacteria bacterium]
MSIPIHGHCAPRFENVRKVFAERFESGAETGAAIAFTLNGEPVVDLWGGYYAPEAPDGSEAMAEEREWERDTIVNTYSTTKGMTAICAHRLVEQGLLDLDAPVARYWPEFAAAGKEDIPVRWLLSHQSGLPAIRKPMPPEALFDWTAMCEALAAQEPWWEPGTRHGYHPVTFGHLVGEVVRRAGGRSVGQMFREDIALPLEADFHIGLDPEQDGRVSRLIGSIAPPRSGAEGSGPQLKGPMADFFRDMNDPTTMVGAAFNNPRMSPETVHSREWRAAEIPAANGHGTARALARIYGALACGGEVDGIRILEPDSIERARAEQVSGPDATLGGLPMRYGLGFMLRSDFMPLSPGPNSFGHPGAGGSVGMADPDAHVGFGYVMNKMQMGLVGGQTAFRVIQAFFEAF